jgi:hypothetical protein
MGRPKNIKTPEILWKLFEDYVKHEAENPMHKVEYVGKEGRVERTPLETPITFMGFECWLWDNQYINDLGDYQKNTDGRYTEYAPIITRITQNCYVHNFKGASVGIFNANIIARKLGLTEKQEVTQTTHTINLAG